MARALARAAVPAALLLGLAFLLVGLCFVAAPRLGAVIFGIEAAEPAALAYVRAIGFRDLALALYIFGLAAAASRRALSLVLAASLVIPACDIALVLSVAGWSAMPQLLIHLAGAAALGLVSLGLRCAELRPVQR
ncbi:DUF4267 domain-containing protein [Enterovirga aerilata]|uniref:DUF4267 domain-containing protein n=1 Tax=Enterovirga aerilata TaxID=2730920 RepID=A0A849IAA3_9HYPH|nr:DUF4267 domain-containing protein [Enterovirga sp. DB1703]NNM74804.1 DUF4267 domain-containing protein [Enterovirga sp. DB1703]